MPFFRDSAASGWLPARAQQLQRCAAAQQSWPRPQQRQRQQQRRRGAPSLVAVLAAAAVAACAVVKVLPAGFTTAPRSSSLSSSSSAAAVVRRAEEEPSSGAIVAARPGEGKKLLVLGGNGYVGREVCRLAVARGYAVTSLSRRGENPEPDNEELSAVNWVQGDATDAGTVKGLVSEVDAVVHAIGLLFDANSGLTNLNLIVSGSKSTPGEDSTYDRITRLTAFNLIEAVRGKFRLPFFGSSDPTPVLFVSAAEAGWPDVTLGPQVEDAAPDWLRQYLVAKRAVEAELQSAPDLIRPVIFRPSLIWSWTKFDVLPVIPIFNLLNFLGLPFVDKTVTVNTLAKAIIAGLEDAGTSGVQRFMQMEELEKEVA